MGSSTKPNMDRSFSGSYLELLAVQAAVRASRRPDRALDLRLAKTLPAGIELHGQPLGKQVFRLAFTRNVDCADRFIKIGFPGWDWTVGSVRKTGGYYAVLWSSEGSDDEGNGATPALALLDAALSCALEEDGYPAGRTALGQSEGGADGR